MDDRAGVQRRTALRCARLGRTPTGETERLEATWNRYARSFRRRRAWSAANPGNRVIRAELLSELAAAGGPVLRRGPVLDVGCGGGWLLRALAESGGPPERLTGVDLRRERLRAASEALPGARFELADARELPFPDSGFAAVTMLTTLSSLPDRESVVRAVGEGLRVLAPGGVLLVYEPRMPNPVNRATRRVGRAELREATGRSPSVEATLTVLPPLARRLGPLTPRGYPLLAAVPALRTHRLTAFRL